jgi:hypothetical protein
MEGSGSVKIMTDLDPDPRDPKTYESYGYGSGSATLFHINKEKANFRPIFEQYFGYLRRYSPFF